MGVADEAQEYLEAVNTFREAGCDPVPHEPFDEEVPCPSWELAEMAKQAGTLEKAVEPFAELYHRKPTRGERATAHACLVAWERSRRLLGS